ncbi:hypothetical protein ABH922_005338 [Rhodococcus sp. 27YEA15]
MSSAAASDWTAPYNASIDSAVDVAPPMKIVRI